KQKRTNLGFDFKTIEKELKIKEKYLKMLEEDEFQLFESSVQAKGFLKNYARFLGLNYEMMIALYRRDFENKDMKRKIEFKDEEIIEVNKITESKILEYLKSITITKRKLQLTFIILTCIFVFLIGFSSLRKSFSKPDLFITSPFEISAPYNGKIAYDANEIILKGKIEKGSSIKVNSEPINVKPNFEFETTLIPLQGDESSIVLETENTLGVKNQIVLNLFRPKQEINQLDAQIIAKANISYIIVKADGLVVYEGSIANGTEPLNYIGQKSIELETQQYENLDVIINGIAYELNAPVSIFESNGDNIVKK
ncbi:helix-turn-helix domain-containing protein, partial [Candidatus Dojkabacteria bacterium]|nr:helix-turn-helix domain-containing protein [Candidatus Dojkabacteria bacterium]